MAWKLTAHNDALCELDPSYDGCPTACVAPERDRARGCPECPVTQMYEQAKDEMLEEFGRIAADRGYKPGHKWQWSLDKLLTDVGAAAGSDAAVGGKGYRPDWPVGLRRMVTILREERATLRRAKDLELKRNLEATGNAGRG